MNGWEWNANASEPQRTDREKAERSTLALKRSATLYERSGMEYDRSTSAAKRSRKQRERSRTGFNRSTLASNRSRK